MLWLQGNWSWRLRATLFLQTNALVIGLAAALALAGLALATGLSRVAASFAGDLLYGVDALDPLTFGIVLPLLDALVFDVFTQPQPAWLKFRVGDLDVARVAAEFVASKAEMERRADKKVMVDAVQLIATEKNRVALTLRDEGRQQEAQKVLQGNVKYLQDNYRRWGSSSLKDLSLSNEEDSKNLAPAQWNRQRKKMRRTQYKFEMQQSY